MQRFFVFTPPSFHLSCVFSVRVFPFFCVVYLERFFSGPYSAFFKISDPGPASSFISDPDQALSLIPSPNPTLSLISNPDLTSALMSDPDLVFGFGSGKHPKGVLDAKLRLHLSSTKIFNACYLCI